MTTLDRLVRLRAIEARATMRRLGTARVDCARAEATCRRVGALLRETRSITPTQNRVGLDLAASSRQRTRLADALAAAEARLASVERQAADAERANRLARAREDAVAILSTARAAERLRTANWRALADSPALARSLLNQRAHRPGALDW